MIRPPRLRYGDTIGLAAPAGVLRGPEQVERAVQTLRAMGFEVRVGQHVLARHGFLAGTDQQRADDLMTLFEDEDVRAIVCMRGGWGCARMLPLLDYEAIRANPKAVVGYSDVTALLLALYARAGLVSFHGPVGISSWGGLTETSFLDTLVRGRTLHLEGDTAPRRLPVQTVRGGTAEGPLVGGNLTVAAALAGSPYLPSFDGHVVFFEEVREEPYRLDRLLTQLALSGHLRRVAGVVFGQCERCSGDTMPEWSAEDVLRDHLAATNAPAWIGAPIGHVSPVYTVPVGVMARVDAFAGTLETTEPAVS